MQEQASNKRILAHFKTNNKGSKGGAKKESKTYPKLIAAGKVLDEKNEELIGVSVLIEGTTYGVIGNIDGNFSINLDGRKDNYLIISYSGYETQKIFIPASKDKLVLDLGKIIMIKDDRRKKRNQPTTSKK